MNDDIAIKVEDLYKTFKLPHEKHGSLKSAIINIGRTNRSYEKQEVLKNINFTIKKGEFFGIVGRNGSGKSTLLKLLAGIYTPDKGLVQLNGSLTPFIELGVGFNPELTGRENVFLNGALLGFGRTEMEAMYDDIVEFAELEKFMDQKLKNYSSGMQVRLAFSIAIRAKSDILLLDEVLAVGDEAFQRKCYQYFAELRKKNATVILVTHDMDAVRRFCTAALILDKGIVKTIGNSETVAKQYSELNRPKVGKNKTPVITTTGKTEYATITTHSINDKGEQTDQFTVNDQKITLKVTIAVHKVIKNAVFGLTVEKSNHETIFAHTTEAPEAKIPPTLKAGSTISYEIIIDNIFGEDNYEVDVALMSLDRTEVYCRFDNALTLKIARPGKKGWLLQPNHKAKTKVDQGSVSE